MSPAAGRSVGAAAPLLLNLVLLQPGEGPFVRPGTLHSYLGGNGFEVMSSSDNVVRGGLTSKYVNQAALEAIALRESGPPDIVSPQQESAGMLRYALDDRGVSEFEVRVISLGADQDPPAIEHRSSAKPCVLLCVEGSVEIRSTTAPAGREALEISAGASAWIPACADHVGIRARESARLFEVRVP